MSDNAATKPQSGSLPHLRVLDLSTERAWLTGRILADLGATVTKIETPGGDPARVDQRVLPTRDPSADSPAWLAFNRGKRSVTLNLHSGEGRTLFLRLVSQADVVIESFTPCTLDSWEIGYQTLAEVNPALVLTSVSPFGQTGPYSRYAASDLIVAAMGGAVWVNGDPDRAPVRPTTNQYFLHAAAEAAVHTVAAAHHAAKTGLGQHVDVSAQLAVMRTLMNVVPGPHTDGSVVDRSAFGEPHPMQPYRQVFECADGHVMAMVPFGPGAKGYVQWLRDEAQLPETLGVYTDEALESPTLASDISSFPDTLSHALAAYFRGHTKKDLTHKALDRRLLLVPINNVADLYADEQLEDRSYYTPIEFDGHGAVITPTRWVRMHRTPLVDLGGTAAPGDHNHATWVEQIGLTAEAFADYLAIGVI